jgi:hypothetical protein
MEFESTTDEELIELYKRTASELSYYNCAEGMSWYAEKEQRRICSGKLRTIKQEMDSRGLEEPVGNYMI